MGHIAVRISKPPVRHAPVGDVTSSDRSAVLLLSHGSRDPRAEYVVEELVSAVAAGTGSTVRAAHLEFTVPTPVVALRQLAAEGFTSVRLVPLLFTPGYHASRDVPVAVKASFATRGMHVSVAPPLLSVGRRGRDLLLKALTDRLAQAGAAPDVDALVLASAGSSSETARLHIESLARDLAQAHGIPVAHAFASASPPSLTQALEALSDKGIQRPAVASLFVAPGRLTDSVVAACPDLPVAGPLGVSPAFVELLVSQARMMSTAL
jgi:sirohydrochlorin ferrochelatase